MKKDDPQSFFAALCILGLMFFVWFVWMHSLKREMERINQPPNVEEMK